MIKLKIFINYEVKGNFIKEAKACQYKLQELLFKKETKII